MPRRPRFVMPGIAHHITQRDNNRQDVFFSDGDRARYLEILKQHCQRHRLLVLGKRGLSPFAPSLFSPPYGFPQ